ncbi:hypothetical protein Q73A0000_11520 [Kaistella flava (ex Peng et al. 2021)]|uniref:TonB C-terminal domain-containing protein n=1 Tax=Kaistella flava (ex Peng et al. 2021) TaxID=2038776 RepID=A0A7M2YBX6_9FLAO|nr:energy transducer TonB [Kaistella flava (ex Peng et al. 2021)]QOW10942.1 hypothetical protein Q73A0000_11520 [Kaistella flava (ex Peng et al. 2021)]
MKKKQFLIIFLFFSSFFFAQKTTKTSPLPNRDVILEGEVIPATFPEGNEAFSQLVYSGFITENIDCNQSGMQRTRIEFIIERNGALMDVKATGSNQKLNKEAIRVVRSIQQRWNPATLDGANVRSHFTQYFTIVCE